MAILMRSIELSFSPEKQGGGILEDGEVPEKPFLSAPGMVVFSRSHQPDPFLHRRRKGT
jgi:hypothetical protein